MTDEELTTNERIAELLLKQTYAERMDMANYLISAIDDWPANDINQDGDAMAALLDGWAQSELPAPEEA